MEPRDKSSVPTNAGEHAALRSCCCAARRSRTCQEIGTRWPFLTRKPTMMTRAVATTQDGSAQQHKGQPHAWPCAGCRGRNGAQQGDLSGRRGGVRCRGGDWQIPSEYILAPATGRPSRSGGACGKYSGGPCTLKNQRHQKEHHGDGEERMVVVGCGTAPRPSPRRCSRRHGPHGSEKRDVRQPRPRRPPP